jgi:hypothetical protein
MIKALPDVFREPIRDALFFRIYEPGVIRNKGLNRERGTETQYCRRYQGRIHLEYQGVTQSGKQSFY